MIKVWIMFGLATLLMGCGATSLVGEADMGGAVYDYQHTTADGGSCKINGTSAKEVPGVEIEITEGCGLKVKANASSPTGDAFGAIRGLVDKMPDMSVVP